MAEVVCNRIGVTRYLVPGGPLSDPETLGSLQVEIDNCLAAHENQLVVDLNHVPAVNSRALELLLDCRDRLSLVGGMLTLVNASPLNLDILEATGLRSHFKVMERSGEEAQHGVKSAQTRGQRLGEILVEKGLVEQEKIDHAFKLQAQTGKRMGQILVEKGWVAESDLLKCLSQQLGIPHVRLRMGLSDPEIRPVLDKEVALRLNVLPLFQVRGELSLAMSDPQSVPTVDEVAQRTGCTIRPVLVLKEEIQAELNQSTESGLELNEYLGELDGDLEVVENPVPEDYTAIDELASGSPVVNLINAIVQRAIQDHASDIHIEPSRTKSRVRLRIDGVLYELMTPSLEIHPALVSRLKVMANLDIAERRLPQDGRIQVNTQGRVVDLRFSSLPGIFGEKVVLRVLDKQHGILEIDNLGMEAGNRKAFIELLNHSHGLLLVTGPTGSGKTTTLYSALNHLNSIDKSIVTIEDPVEYQLDVVNQNQVKESIDLGFAKLLKHVLRQDPDIVMVGEIRDPETARIAVQGALTGHLVLSTLHTNDSIGAISRLMEMGIEPYLLSSALIGVMAQRLIRTLCPDCKTSFVAPPALVDRFGWQDQGQVRLSKGRGCPVCYDSGYRGRVAIHEILLADSALQKLITSNPSQDDFRQHVGQSKMRTLFDHGLDHVLQGRTTVEELSRVVTQ